MAARAPGRLQGDDLIGEVLRNMEEGIFRIGGKSLVPSVYRIYLHPDDYEPFRYVVPFISGEIRAALDERLGRGTDPRSVPGAHAAGEDRRGRGDRSRRKPSPRGERFVDGRDVPGSGWKLQPGEIEVSLDFGAPQKADYGAGSLTRRIFPRGEEPPAEAARPPKSPMSQRLPRPLHGRNL